MINMPVSSTPTAGDEMSYGFAIDSEQILTVKSLADGTGGIDTKQILLATTDFGTTAAPSIAFGDGDTGFYESADDTLQVVTSGSAFAKFASSRLSNSGSIGRTSVYFANPANVTPNYSFHSDENTGMYWAAADNISFAAGGIETVRIEDPADLAATETGMWLYDADNGTLQQVTVGADDSGGSGFKLLRIAN